MDVVAIGAMRAAVLVALALGFPRGQLAAQQARRSCTLILRPTPSTRSLSVNEDRSAPDVYVTYVGGGMRWTCGDARMRADSAIKYDRAHRVEMMGRVHYADTTRVLDSRRLTYYQSEDRILAEGDVVLTRLRSGAVLRGPRAEFFRTARVKGDQTLATGRPHLTLPSGPLGSGAEPFEVDADTTQFFGEDRAKARGSVHIVRSDLDATADSVRFSMRSGSGMLYGSPRVKGERYEITGDSIRVSFADSRLRDVEALGSATASGTAFDLRAARVRARLGRKEVEEMWAYGSERAVGVSGRYRLAGDSLRFAFLEGRLDSVAAVGAAAAEEASEGAAADSEPTLSVQGTADWVAGDTVLARFIPMDSSGPSVDMESGKGVRIDGLRALGRARAFYSVVRDSAESKRPSHSYLIGRDIAVIFLEGKASEVIGADAIGVYLEPAEEGGGR